MKFFSITVTISNRWVKSSFNMFPGKSCFSQLIQAKMLKSDHQGLESAAKCIRDGLLVAFPTETVYGLGADALNEPAVEAIFKLKRRPSTNPLIVHIEHIGLAEKLISLNSIEKSVFDCLAISFWPGPLTLGTYIDVRYYNTSSEQIIVSITEINISIYSFTYSVIPASAIVPGIVTAFTGMIALRSPAHPIAQKLLNLAGVPIAAPSANIHGHVSPTLSQHVWDDFKDSNIHIIDGDFDVPFRTGNRGVTCIHGIESTVVKINADSKSILILREGIVSKESIMSTLQKFNFSDWVVQVKSNKVVFEKIPLSKPNSINIEGFTKAQISPGQGISHYSPRTACYIVDHVPSKISSEPFENHPAIKHYKLKDCVVIDFGQTLQNLKNQVIDYCDLSPSADVKEGAKNLFLELRRADKIPNIKLILIASLRPEHQYDIGPALTS